MVRGFLKKLGVWGLRFTWSTVNNCTTEVVNNLTTPQYNIIVVL